MRHSRVFVLWFIRVPRRQTLKFGGTTGFEIRPKTTSFERSQLASDLAADNGTEQLPVSPLNTHQSELFDGIEVVALVLIL